MQALHPFLTSGRESGDRAVFEGTHLHDDRLSSFLRYDCPVVQEVGDAPVEIDGLDQPVVRVCSQPQLSVVAKQSKVQEFGHSQKCTVANEMFSSPTFRTKSIPCA